MNSNINDENALRDSAIKYKYGSNLSNLSLHFLRKLNILWRSWVDSLYYIYTIYYILYYIYTILWRSWADSLYYIYTILWKELSRQFHRLYILPTTRQFGLYAGFPFYFHFSIFLNNLQLTNIKLKIFQGR